MTDRQRRPGSQNANAQRVLQAAAELLDAGGLAAVSTRAVAAAAGVQAPVIYRQFGDKEGLLNAVAHFVLREYVRAKQRGIVALDDPVAELRRTWDLHVQFGLSHPEIYLRAYGKSQRAPETIFAATRSDDSMHNLLVQLAEQGRLRSSVERATNIMYASAVGTVFTLIRKPSAQKDPRFPDITWENALSAILDSDRPDGTGSFGIPARAAALAEAVRDVEQNVLSSAEQAVLIEWLSRLSNQTPRGERSAT